ncbi:MAG TPA: DUF2231 domain-containing protein [Candidatus Eisenbacteria bacterium]|nr:DUF2231 domain-containing protein [Candidatus Eisenbacteria bacterium]
MPDIGVYHPQVVHFVVAFLFLGVVARIVSFLPVGERFRWIGSMAATLIILGTLASIAAVQSGKDAHGPVERVPGAREAVVEHEESGERTRNVFIAVALCELIALAVASRKRFGTIVRGASALGGILGVVLLYKASLLGGELVYGYAGGVGIRSGDPSDVRRLLVAGLYHNARVARESGDTALAGRLTEQLVAQMPNDAGVRFLGIESMLRDRADPRAALAALAVIPVPEDDARLQIRRGLLMAEAYEAAGARDSMRKVIADLKRRYPDNTRVKQAVERLTRPARSSGSRAPS